MNMMNPKEIKTHPTFEKLFPINEDLLRTIEEDMRDNKFDLSQPVILANWEGQDELVCIDGHTRLQAAIKAGIDQIPVWIREDFETEEAALGHAIKLQSHRRNMTDAELMTCIGALDQIRPRGGNGKGDRVSSMPQSCGKESGRSASAKETAEIVGCSPRKVEQARTIENHASPEILEAVKNREMSINKAYQETQKRRKEVKEKEIEAEVQEEEIQAAESEMTDATETKDEDESQDQDASEMDAEGEEEDETDSDESELMGDQKADTPNGEEAEEDAFVTVRISLSQYKALCEYDGTLEEKVEEAIERYLEDLERVEDCDQAEYEAMWESTDEDDDDQEEDSEVDAA